MAIPFQRPGRGGRPMLSRHGFKGSLIKPVKSALAAMFQVSLFIHFIENDEKRCVKPHPEELERILSKIQSSMNQKRDSINLRIQ